LWNEQFSNAKLGEKMGVDLRELVKRLTVTASFVTHE